MFSRLGRKVEVEKHKIIYNQGSANERILKAHQTCIELSIALGAFIR